MVPLLVAVIRVLEDRAPQMGFAQNLLGITTISSDPL